MNLKRLLLMALAAAAIALAPAASVADVSFTIDGVSETKAVQGVVNFHVVDANTLEVTVTNTTTGSGLGLGQVLTGVVWNWNPYAGNVGTDSAALGYVEARELISVTESAFNSYGNTDITSPLSGFKNTPVTWAAKSDGTVDGSSFDFGVAAAAWTTLAGTTDGDDYGVLSSAHTATRALENNSPFARNTVFLRLSGFENLSESKIAGAALLWTSQLNLAPDDQPGGPGGGTVVPEASSLMLLAFGGLPLGLAGLKMRKRR